MQLFKDNKTRKIVKEAKNFAKAGGDFNEFVPFIDELIRLHKNNEKHVVFQSNGCLLYILSKRSCIRIR